MKQKNNNLCNVMYNKHPKMDPFLITGKHKIFALQSELFEIMMSGVRHILAKYNSNTSEIEFIFRCGFRKYGLF